MSDQATATASTVTDAAPLFAAEELREFDRDDTEAGRNICKMLSMFFFYTVIVMGLSTWVTIQWVL